MHSWRGTALSSSMLRATDNLPLHRSASNGPAMPSQTLALEALDEHGRRQNDTTTRSALPAATEDVPPLPLYQMILLTLVLANASFVNTALAQICVIELPQI